MSPRIPLAAALLAILALPGVSAAQSRDLVSLADGIFARHALPDGPGCALGIDRAGLPRFTRAWGSANLEHQVPNTPATLFEAGSVAKQFTAAAVVLLALDGRLGLEDDVRKYVPELPDHGPTITIRHLLTHTSGLRDWGDIAELEGWPRGTRAHTHAHVLDILARQRATNFPPGQRYSYSNSGYNLAAVIVRRVSGQSFGEFSRDRLFAPLGLASTQWRDGYRRVVKGRAQAYSPSGSEWRLDMPFEDVQGNGGLLTTVGDLLAWTAMLEQPPPRWRAMVDSLHVVGRLTTGEATGYALGLGVDTYRGVPRVQHTGATAGYRAVLARYPGRGLAIAVLCNAANARAGAYAESIADSLLGAALAPRAAASMPRPDSSARWAPAPASLAEYAGEYFSPDVGTTWRVIADSGKLVLVASPSTRVTLTPTARDRFEGFASDVWFTRDARGRIDALHSASGRAFDVVFEKRGERVGAKTF